MEQFVKLSDVQNILIISQHLHSTPMGDMINRYFEKNINSLPTIKDPREGVVIRRDGQETFSAYKMKSQLFLTHETKAIDKGTEDMEEGA